MDRRADVIVAGGGLAGLTAALELARAGRSVVVLERGEEVGGRAVTRTVGGFHFNVGPHALYRGGRAATILRGLGIPFSGGIPPANGAFALAGGRKHTLPAGFVSLLTTGLFGLPAKLEAGRLLAGLGAIETRGLSHVSVAEWLDAATTRPEVGALFEALVRVATYANDPTRLSAAAALDQLRLAQQKGVLYLDGGWRTLVDGLRRAAEAAGVRVLTHAPAALVEGERAVTGVRLAGGALWQASAVVVAADPATAAALVTGRDTPLERWAIEAVPVRAACLDVALRRLPRPRARFALGIDAPLYASVHSAVARLAPERGALIHVARYLGSDPAPDTTAVERELEKALELLQPGWQGEIAHRRFVPNLIVAHGLPLAAHGGLGGRPGPEVPGLAGLFVAADWVGPEGILADAALASAVRAARSIVSSARSATAAA
jgi:phytoene dehydrogenase-like protein